MKNVIAIIAVALIAVSAVKAQNYQTIDMAAYGTTYTATNAQSFGQTLYTSAAITYDSANITNSITFYAKIDGINYLLGTSSVTNGQYDFIDLNPLALRPGSALVINTTQTNVNIRLGK
ncbi:MAG TPA: hypothetical protein PKI68_01210 [Pontiellaceae bacterium]|nr:hypothetical protein [Pontiellaceae bacterium]